MSTADSGLPLQDEPYLHPDTQVARHASSDHLIRETLAVMRPKPCPYRLIRLGGRRDGAYLVPDDLDGVSACFSPGVSNQKRFEDDLINRYGIASYLCDASSDPESFETRLIPGLQSFRKQWLDLDDVPDSITLDRWVEEDAPEPRLGDLLLQMDIEGAEYRNLISVSDDVLRRFRVLIIEFHGLDRVNDDLILRQTIAPLFKRLDSLFVCVHAHPNNCYGDRRIAGSETNLPVIMELTFLRRDRFVPGNRFENEPQLPHPLDITCCPSRRPVHLNRAWLRCPRSLTSRRKIASDWLFYLLVRMLLLPGRHPIKWWRSRSR